jgi:hypothetical protein
MRFIANTARNMQDQVAGAKNLCDKVIVNVTRAIAAGWSSRDGNRLVLAEIQAEIGRLSVQLDEIFLAATGEKKVR